MTVKDKLIKLALNNKKHKIILGYTRSKSNRIITNYSNLSNKLNCTSTTIGNALRNLNEDGRINYLYKTINNRRVKYGYKVVGNGKENNKAVIHNRNNKLKRQHKIEDINANRYAKECTDDPDLIETNKELHDKALIVNTYCNIRNRYHCSFNTVINKMRLAI